MNIVILGYYRKQLVGASAAGFRLDLQLQVALVFLASIVVSFRILSLVTSLLLTVQLCSLPQPLSSRLGDGLSVVGPPMTDAPVDRLIQALLDIGTTGWAGVDATGGLLAAPRGPHGAPTNEAKCANQPTPRDFLLRRAMSFYVRYVTCSTDSKG